MNFAYSGLIIYGCGGHAKSVADVALACGIESLIFVDEQAREGEMIFGFPVQKNLEPLPAGWGIIAAQGDNLVRQQAVLKSSMLVNIISDTATVGVESIIENGCFVGHHAHIGPLSAIGVGCIINSGAAVEHECEIGNFSHISVNTTLCGKVKIGERCFIGAGATVIDGITICDDVIVGAGAVVVNNITEPGIYLGVPARLMIHE